MRTYILILLELFLGAQILQAQGDSATLLAQSADGKTVKLMWTMKTWNNGITGFDIKRKETLGKWVKLNKEPLLPGIWSKKKMAVSGNNFYDESLLRAKLYRLVKNHTLVETSYSAYLQELNENDSAVRKMATLMAEDYDIALMNGFGYVDHSVTRKTSYEYGLFTEGTDKLLATTTWSYGEIPDLDVVQEITSRAKPGSRGIEVIWTADTVKMKTAHTGGFNIYREGIRLNEQRITENNGGPTVFLWFDKTANSANMIQYSIGAESVFNIEGIIKSYIYNPADHPKEYKTADVTGIASLGYYFKDGTSVKWDFPKEYERFIKGFYVEKNNMPRGYREVSGLLAPSARSFTDKSESQVNGYIKYQIKTVYKDRTDTDGAERIYYYFPLNVPPPPENLKARSITGTGTATVYLTWGPPLPGDSVTDYYKVYLFDPAINRFSPVTEEPVETHNFTYVIKHGTAGTSKFCITAVSLAKNESPFSDTVSVKIPSLELPTPVISKITPDNENKAVIQWQYPDIPDLKGFRISENAVIIANETTLKKDAREYTTGKLEPGTSHEFTIMAVSERGVVSDASAPYPVQVATTPGK